MTRPDAADFEIAGRSIGPGCDPYVIAEISANHRASKAAALEIVAAAAEAGADAVKLQHYKPETITVRSDRPEFQVKGGTIWDGRQLADLYAEAMTPWEWTEDIAAEADRLGLTWFSSPFDRTAVDFLAELDVPAYKIASFEIVDLPLIRYAASKGRPLIISTGMATVGEIDAAVRAATEAGTGEIALLRCNSGYPADPAEMDLRAIPAMQELWSLPIGLSDHTIGSTAAITAVALGACIIEKHLTLRRSDGGPDAVFSAEPDELADLVKQVRDAGASVGSVRFGPSGRELSSILYRRSLRVTRPVSAGELLTLDNVASVRPAGGLHPDRLDEILGLAASVDLDAGAPITLASVGPLPDDVS